MICKVLGLIVNKLAAADKYSLLNRNNFLQHLQIILSQIQKTFSECFSAFPKSRLNFEYFPKNDDPHS